jgi:hypothetical protein
LDRTFARIFIILHPTDGVVKDVLNVRSCFIGYMTLML